jgi:hypothetical protein
VGSGLKQTIVRGAQDGLLAYVGKGGDGRYVPFMFERSVDPSDVEISDETFIITRETALAYREAEAKPAVADLPIAVGDHPSGPSVRAGNKNEICRGRAEVIAVDRGGPIAEMDELLFPRPFEIRYRQRFARDG